MPRFFFDFHGDGDSALDGEGCEFASFELAYLDAFQTMVKMGAEQIIEQRDPSGQWIDIRDEVHRVVATLQFDEVFRKRGRRPLAATACNGGRRSRQFEVLSGDISQACRRAQASVANARQTLARVEARRALMHLGW